jgi:hypothetical protein
MKMTDCEQPRPQSVTPGGAKRPNAAGLRRIRCGDFARPINPA